MSMTITEALAEIKTIRKRLEKKHQSIQSFLLRDAKMYDPLEKDGGSVAFVARERQAADDLQKRLVAIRVAIIQANMTTKLTLHGREMTLMEWLTWRREIAPSFGGLLTNLATVIQQHRVQALRSMRSVSDATVTTPGANDILVNINEAALRAEIEEHEQILGELDGKLSLLNATVTISI